jgi:hypothetical protein
MLSYLEKNYIKLLAEWIWTKLILHAYEVHIDGKVWHLDVGSSSPGAVQ